MLGPWTGNARKTGKISAEMDIHSSVMTMIRTLKLSVIQLTIIHFVKNNNQNTDYSSLRIMVSVNSLHLDEPPKSPVRDWPS